MEMLTLMIILPLCCGLPTKGEQTCPPGHRLQTQTSGPGVCLPCVDGVSFMPEEAHTTRECYNCSQPENLDLEILVAPCNRTHDAEILCRPGYYRSKARSITEKDKCEKCSQCKFPTRPCQAYNDALCCHSKEHGTLTDDEHPCMERPVLCGMGYYFNTKAVKCMPCPENTFMNESSHSHVGCFMCKPLSKNTANHAMITKPCTGSSPTQFGCEHGYFRDLNKDPPTVEVPCSPCRKCQREIRRCRSYRDSVCSSDDDDDSKDPRDYGLERPENVHDKALDESFGSGNSTTCYEGSYLYINNSDGSRTCIPCWKTNSLPDSAADCPNCTNLIRTHHPPDCSRKLDDKMSDSTEFQIFSILMFSLAFPVDILYVYLYSNKFLKNTVGYSPGRNRTRAAGRLSRLIGTTGIDLHIVLTCVHLFGILCEVDVVKMNGETRGIFTVAVGVVSIVLYFADAVIFLFVTRLFCADACVSVSGSQNVSSSENPSLESVHAFLDNT